MQFTDGASYTISNPISFSATRTTTPYPNILTTDQAQDSRVTLSGVISSAQGAITPIRLDGTSSRPAALI